MSNVGCEPQRERCFDASINDADQIADLAREVRHMAIEKADGFMGRIPKAEGEPEFAEAAGLATQCHIARLDEALKCIRQSLYIIQDHLGRLR